MIDNKAINNSKWKKVLYEHQQTPDNYVSDSFLDCLQKDVYLDQYQLKDIIIESFSITAEIASVVIFIIVFLCLSYEAPLEGSTKSSNFIKETYSVVALVTILFYVTLILLSSKNNQRNQIKNTMIFIAGGFSVSPILKTLTETISTNTIYTLFGIMMLAHLIFYDYGAKAYIVNRHISLNAGIFGAVCLASRLSSSYLAFCLLIATSDIFLLSSMLRENLRSMRYRKSLVLFTLILSIIAFVGLLLLTSVIYPILLAMLILAINIICPYGFYKLQKHKTRLHGPWDVATGWLQQD